MNKILDYTLYGLIGAGTGWFSVKYKVAMMDMILLIIFFLTFFEDFKRGFYDGKTRKQNI